MTFPNIRWLFLFKNKNLDSIFSIACFVCLYPNMDLASFLKINKAEITVVSISFKNTAGSVWK